MRTKEKDKTQDGLTVHVGITLDKTLWARVRRLAKSHRVSSAFIVERALQQVADSGKVYWPSTADIEAREHEKFGPATPTYDGEDSKAPAEAGRSAPKSPAQ